jgi:hypothetical protein
LVLIIFYTAIGAAIGILQYEFPETPAQEEAREVVKAALVARAQVEKQKRLPLPPRKRLLNYYNARQDCATAGNSVTCIQIKM